MENRDIKCTIGGIDPETRTGAEGEDNLIWLL
jgi:hypothetical protein